MNRKNTILLTVFLLLVFSSYSQQVGLVLSGGGSKGAAHLGVIKALEENNIPIDYITGTSIGAVVGSLYGMGYSPDEILEIFKSKEFSYWYTGQVEEKYIYGFKKEEARPDMFTLRFNIRDSLVVESRYLPTSFIDPIQMNIVFLQLFSQATAKCDADFDKLMVPLRCIASDVYEKKSVVIRSGNLGDAVRASMSVPFVFKPIMINGNLLFDGGIYDNFPVKVMQEDFNPDFIIGSNVSSNLEKPTAEDIALQIGNMIIQQTDYSIQSEQGILFDFKFNNDLTELLDFSQAEELFRLGYEKAMLQIPHLKKQIQRELTLEELEQKRTAYKKNLPELTFKKIEIAGINKAQEAYIANTLQQEEETINLEQFKYSYFKLMADKKITEIRPVAIYNKEKGYFDLFLDVELDDNLLFSIGGNISSSVSSQAYFALHHQTIATHAWTFDLSAQFGRVYNGLKFITQIDFPGKKLPFYTKISANIHTFNFYQGNEPFYEDDLSSSFSQKENFAKIHIGFPVRMRSKLEIGLAQGRLNDFYYQNPIHLSYSEDKSQYEISHVFANISANTLNDKQFANEGYAFYISAIGAYSEESFEPGLSSNNEYKTIYQTWAQISADYERYIVLDKYFTLGVSGNTVLSSRKKGNNYSSSILQAPAFTPTNHSKIVFNEAFRNNKFAAVGLKPIYNINRQVSFRSEFYAFVPYEPILRNENNRAYYGKPFSNFEYLGELSFIYKLPFASMSFFVNHYSAPKQNWNIGFNIGYLIFNDKLLK